MKREVEATKAQHHSELSKVKTEVKLFQGEINNKNVQLEVREKEMALLKQEIERMKKNGGYYVNESQISKLILLEKNLETTFQKLVSTSCFRVRAFVHRSCSSSYPPPSTTFIIT